MNDISLTTKAIGNSNALKWVALFVFLLIISMIAFTVIFLFYKYKEAEKVNIKSQSFPSYIKSFLPPIEQTNKKNLKSSSSATNSTTIKSDSPTKIKSGNIQYTEHFTQLLDLRLPNHNNNHIPDKFFNNFRSELNLRLQDKPLAENGMFDLPQLVCATDIKHTLDHAIHYSILKKKNDNYYTTKSNKYIASPLIFKYDATVKDAHIQELFLQLNQGKTIRAMCSTKEEGIGHSMYFDIMKYDGNKIRITLNANDNTADKSQNSIKDSITNQLKLLGNIFIGNGGYQVEFIHEKGDGYIDFNHSLCTQGTLYCAIFNLEAKKNEYIKYSIDIKNSKPGMKITKEIFAYHYILAKISELNEQFEANIEYVIELLNKGVKDNKLDLTKCLNIFLLKNANPNITYTNDETQYTWDIICKELNKNSITEEDLKKELLKTEPSYPHVKVDDICQGQTRIMIEDIKNKVIRETLEEIDMYHKINGKKKQIVLDRALEAMYNVDLMEVTRKHKDGTIQTILNKINIGKVNTYQQIDDVLQENGLLTLKNGGSVEGLLPSLKKHYCVLLNVFTQKLLEEINKDIEQNNHIELFCKDGQYIITHNKKTICSQGKDLKQNILELVRFYDQNDDLIVIKKICDKEQITIYKNDDFFQKINCNHGNHSSTIKLSPGMEIKIDNKKTHTTQKDSQNIDHYSLEIKYNDVLISKNKFTLQTKEPQTKGNYSEVSPIATEKSTERAA